MGPYPAPGAGPGCSVSAGASVDWGAEDEPFFGFSTLAWIVLHRLQTPGYRLQVFSCSLKAVAPAMIPGTRILAAMSGGVDSSVAAARLVDDGWEVVGVTLHLWDYPDDAREKTRCCAPEDAHDARLVADHLGIPHYTFDRRELFRDRVVEPFVAAYLEGRTPSPCVWCNRSVKMRELLGMASLLGAGAVATGHYARIVPDASGRARLHQGRDAHKDQSYFLYMLESDELERVRLPLGDSLKDEVRREARERGLPGADKGESQELCFVPDGAYADFVEQRAANRVRPGPIVDERGREVGRHAGIHRYTVGQRRGLGVALGAPAYVSRIDGDRVVVGGAEALASSAAVLRDDSWSDDMCFPRHADVKVRSHHKAAAARLERTPEGVRLWFDEPVRAVAPGQIAVAYDGDRVLGGGTIV